MKKGFTFSFSKFDRTHELFNLGGNTKNKVIDSRWFLDLFDCLKNVNTMTISELKSSMFELHPINWDNTNITEPSDSPQFEYWQFRISKSKGRVIGILIDNPCYYVYKDKSTPKPFFYLENKW